MTVPQRTAVTLPNPRGIEATLDQAVWAEEQGYDDVWFADSSGIDALTLAVAVAERTSRVRIGTAIIPVFTRTPAVLASTTHILNKISNGRFILGLGSSSQPMMVNWNGQVFEKPLTRVKETTQLVRQMLSGAKSDFDGVTVQSHGYRQPPIPPGEQPIYIAALRSRMMQMAAEVGDGVIVNLFPRQVLPRMMRHMKIGAEKAGKRAEDVEVVCRQMVCVTKDKEAARNVIRASFAPYYATPVYNDFLAWSGYPKMAAEIKEGWAAKDRARTCGALTDELVDQIAILGTAEECQDKIRECSEGGITTNIISATTPNPDEAEATYQAFTRENFSI
jgi:probable F420-dependent oxidoreductase